MAVTRLQGKGNLRFGLLRVEGINVRLHKHGSKDQVFEDLNSLKRASLVIVTK